MASTSPIGQSAPGPSSDEKNLTTSRTVQSLYPGGWRHQVFIAPTRPMPTSPISRPAIAATPRIEDRIRCAKDTGLRNLPFGDFANNACWVELICVAQDLIAFTQALVLDGDMSSAEPKRLRYALLHTAGRLTTTSRRTTLRLQSEWPWAKPWPMPSANFDRCH